MKPLILLFVLALGGCGSSSIAPLPQKSGGLFEGWKKGFAKKCLSGDEEACLQHKVAVTLEKDVANLCLLGEQSSCLIQELPPRSEISIENKPALSRACYANESYSWLACLLIMNEIKSAKAEAEKELARQSFGIILLGCKAKGIGSSVCDLIPQIGRDILKKDSRSPASLFLEK